MNKLMTITAAALATNLAGCATVMNGTSSASRVRPLSQRLAAIE